MLGHHSHQTVQRRVLRQERLHELQGLRRVRHLLQREAIQEGVPRGDVAARVQRAEIREHLLVADRGGRLADKPVVAPVVPNRPRGTGKKVIVVAGLGVQSRHARRRCSRIGRREDPGHPLFERFRDHDVRQRPRILADPGVDRLRRRHPQQPFARRGNGGRVDGLRRVRIGERVSHHGDHLRLCLGARRVAPAHVPGRPRPQPIGIEAGRVGEPEVDREDLAQPADRAVPGNGESADLVSELLHHRGTHQGMGRSPVRGIHALRQPGGNAQHDAPGVRAQPIRVAQEPPTPAIRAGDVAGDRRLEPQRRHRQGRPREIVVRQGGAARLEGCERLGDRPGLPLGVDAAEPPGRAQRRGDDAGQRDAPCRGEHAAATHGRIRSRQPPLRRDQVPKQPPEKERTGACGIVRGRCRDGQVPCLAMDLHHDVRDRSPLAGAREEHAAELRREAEAARSDNAPHDRLQRHAERLHLLRKGEDPPPAVRLALGLQAGRHPGRQTRDELAVSFGVRGHRGGSGRERVRRAHAAERGTGPSRRQRCAQRPRAVLGVEAGEEFREPRNPVALGHENVDRERHGETRHGFLNALAHLNRDVERDCLERHAGRRDRQDDAVQRMAPARRLQAVEEIVPFGGLGGTRLRHELRRWDHEHRFVGHPPAALASPARHAPRNPHEAPCVDHELNAGIGECRESARTRLPQHQVPRLLVEVAAVAQARSAMGAQRFAQHRVAFPHPADVAGRAGRIVEAFEARQDAPVQPVEAPPAQCLQSQEHDRQRGNRDEAVRLGRERFRAVDRELRADVPDEQREQHEEHQTHCDAGGDEAVEDLEEAHGRSRRGASRQSPGSVGETAGRRCSRSSSSIRATSGSARDCVRAYRVQ